LNIGLGKAWLKLSSSNLQLCPVIIAYRTPDIGIHVAYYSLRASGFQVRNLQSMNGCKSAVLTIYNRRTSYKHRQTDMAPSTSALSSISYTLTMTCLSVGLTNISLP